MKTKAVTSLSPVVLQIAGTSVPVTHELVGLGTVSLDPENPRIRFLLNRRLGKKRPTEEVLLDLLKEQPGYAPLQKAIRKAGGIHDPVIVRHDGRIVEGNSRTTALKTLHGGNKTDPKWQTIPVVRLPVDIPEHLIGLLMASYHIAGKTTWRPYAQADQIYQLVHVHKCSLEEVADETRMTSKEVQQHLDAFEFLVNEVLPKVPNGDGAEVLESKFSHALEFVKRKKLEGYRRDPEVRKQVANLLVEDKIKGAEVRELHSILENKKATAVLRERGFKGAKDALRKTDPVSTSSLLKKMQALTKALRHMGQRDIGLFTSEPKAAEILVQLHQATKNVATIAGISSETTNA